MVKPVIIMPRARSRKPVGIVKKHKAKINRTVGAGSRRGFWATKKGTQGLIGLNRF